MKVLILVLMTSVSFGDSTYPKKMNCALVEYFSGDSGVRYVPDAQGGVLVDGNYLLAHNELEYSASRTLDSKTIFMRVRSLEDSKVRQVSVEHKNIISEEDYELRINNIALSCSLE